MHYCIGLVLHYIGRAHTESKVHFPSTLNMELYVAVEYARTCFSKEEKILICTVFSPSQPARPLALLQSSSYENRGTEWSKIRVFGMLQRVRAGREGLAG